MTTFCGVGRQRLDFVQLQGLDTYVYLYNRRVTQDEKRNYIASRVAQADWIVIDDSYTQWYDHLPEAIMG